MMRFLSLTLVLANGDINPSKNAGNTQEAQSPCDDLCELKRKAQIDACPKGETCPCSDGTCGCTLATCGNYEEQLIAELSTGVQPGVGYCRCVFVNGIGKHEEQGIDQNHVRIGGKTELAEFNASDYVECNQAEASEKCESDLCLLSEENKIYVETECPTTHFSEIGNTHECKCKRKPESEEEIRVEERLL